MKFANLALSLLAGIGAGCTSVPPTSPVSLSDLPNCFDSNYDEEGRFFTIKSDVGNPVNQQCSLTVGPRGNVASPQRLTAGSYRVYLSNGGGGAGGTLQSFLRGGGGAGAVETQATVNLTEGVYKLTIGAGGPGGSVCVPGLGFGGGPGWFGSPSNIIRVATGELVIGTPGADRYARPTRSQIDRISGKKHAANARITGKTDAGHGGSGPGQTSGGHGATAATAKSDSVEPTSGASKLVLGGHGARGCNWYDFGC